MSNQWVIEAQKFCCLSINHQWHRLLIDVIDYSWMIHRLLIDYYTVHERHFSCFLVPFFFFSCGIFLSVLNAFSLYLKFLWTMLRCKVLITNADDSQLCNISLCPTLYLITKQQDSNQPVWNWQFVNLDNLDGATVKVWFNRWWTVYKVIGKSSTCSILCYVR